MAQQAVELLDELDDQLASAVRVAATRAEHIRLTRMQSVTAQLRSAVPPPVIEPGDVIVLPDLSDSA
jgi:hypothetical protein